MGHGPTLWAEPLQLSARAALSIANTTRTNGPFAASDLFAFIAMIYTQEITIKGREMLPKWGGNSARLNMFNCLKTGHPIEPKGPEGYSPIRGWKCLGYAQAPYKGCETHAVIYDYSGEVFWAHGAADMPVECEANDLAHSQKGREHGPANTQD